MNSLAGVMVIGLTGQSGAGKTSVCEAFRKNGFAVINADLISRQVVEKGSPCLKELAEFFSDNILTAEGELDRRVLADIVFSNHEKLEVLNSIIYPYITAEILNQIRGYADAGQRWILLDAPTLFESRADDFCEIVISVIAREELRRERIMARDGLTVEQANNRMSSQHDEHFFENNSDFIIKNNKDIENLNAVAEEVIDKIKEYYDAKEAI